MFRQQIEDTIKENRPNLSASSLKTYCSTLFNLHKRLAPAGDERIEWFTEHAAEIVDSLKHVPPRSRKSVLSACFVLTGLVEPYRTKMIEDCVQTNSDYKQQRCSEKEKENWLDYEQVIKVYEDLKARAIPMLLGKAILDKALVNQFWLVAFLSGAAGVVPRRSLDYSLLKIRNFDPKTDNYYKAGKLIFYKYKTAKQYGKQEVVLPKDLDKLVKKWIKLNPSDFFLSSSKDAPLSTSQITKALNTAFAKKISTDMLRHIFVSHALKNVPALTELQNLATSMGHSIATQQLYRRID